MYARSHPRKLPKRENLCFNVVNVEHSFASITLNKPTKVGCCSERPSTSLRHHVICLQESAALGKKYPPHETFSNSRYEENVFLYLKFTHGLLEFPMASTFVHPTRQGLRGHAFKFLQQRCCTRRRQFAFTIRAVPFWNKLSAKIVNASSVKSFKALLDAHWQSLFPEVPI